METTKGTEVRSASCGEKTEELGADSLQFGEEIQTLMSVPPESGSSFTALLELPANQAMELFHSPRPEETPAKSYHYSPIFAPPENSAATKVKKEPIDSDSVPVVSDPVVSNNKQSTKRKEREKKVKESAKKSKEVAKDGEELPYVHVRARRGQATDSHSLAERARREKINARMKLLQELVPGCNKISGTAMVLDEIINHVQTLQRQVEFLSMRLAAVNPRIDINLDSLLAAESGSLMDSNLPSMVMPLMWPEGQLIGNRQQYQHLWHFDGLHQPIWGREEDNPNFVTPENSLISHDSSANADHHVGTASLHSNQLKMEL